MEKNIEALCAAQACFMAMSRFRADRERNKKFNYGDQWSDKIDINGQMISEEKFILDQGSVPLKNNMIRRLVRSVIGVYNSQSNAPHCIARDPQQKDLAQAMGSLLKCNAELNRLQALYTRSLEEFLISGLVVHRKWYGERDGKTECWTDYVSPSNFFVDYNMRDFRSWDCTCIGEVHDIDFGDLCRRFAASQADCEELREIYDVCADGNRFANAWQETGYASPTAKPFMMPRTAGMCRVIEVWRKEFHPVYKCIDMRSGEMYAISPADFQKKVEKENARRRRKGDLRTIAARWEMHQAWNYYFLSPLGHVLAKGESPYRHGSHPFVLKAYPLIDGEIHAFVSDVIDQQKYTNRLITMYDWMVRASAKGVLLIPQECIPRGTSAQDIAQAWSQHNGVVIYRSSMSGDRPQQVVGNMANAGITELLNLQLKFFEDISGVNGALQGKLSNSAMSAELYGQQTQAATTALLDVLGAFNEFVRDAAYKDASNIQQFYSEAKVRRIVGESVTIPTGQFSDAIFDLSIAPCDATPATKELSNQHLLEIWRSGQITLNQLLTAGHFPFADALLASVAG